MAAARRNKTSPGLGRWGRENSFASGRVVEVGGELPVAKWCRTYLVARLLTRLLAQVPSFPLPMVLHVLGRHTVDYWSLDVEGSEAALLCR